MKFRLELTVDTGWQLADVLRREAAKIESLVLSPGRTLLNIDGRLAGSWSVTDDDDGLTAAERDIIDRTM